MNLILRQHKTYTITNNVKRISFTDKFATIMNDTIHTLPTHKIVGVFA
jgi:hypothetical protein